ncbi:TonB-dependent receptor [Emticicia sp. ODNR4P]|nr:TonB-dependent receptor [Emticicia sp. ODNR4P]
MKSFGILILTILFIFQTGYAQKSNRVIQGRLLDSLTHEALPYATVRLETSDNAKPQVILTDDKGDFRFETALKSNLTLRFDYMGYQKKALTVENEKGTLGNIFLRASIQLLESVTVTGVKPNMVSSLEKQSFKASQFEAAKGGTATDVLKNIPSVTVNAEGEITVRGSKGFLILVNGKPSQIDAATLLSQIPANTIEKIEMITAPSAKYDADGKAGIINIITKTGTNDGISLSTNLQYGLPRIKRYYNANEPERYGADATINYRKGKIDATVAGNYLQNDIAGRREGDVNTTINQIFTQFPSDGERSLKRENYGIRGTLVYSLSKQDEISAGAYLGERSQYRTADIFYQNTKTDLNTGLVIGKANYYNTNLVLKSGSFKVFNIDYTHKFHNNSSLTISTLYENALIDGYTKNRNLNINDYKDTLQYTYNTGYNPLNAIRLKADYEKNFGIGKLTIGYQFRQQQQDGNFVYLEKEGSNTPFVLNPLFTANVSVYNRIHGVYAQYAGTFKKWEFSTGMRYENALREFKDNKGNAPKVLNLSNIFPSANVLYNVDNSLKLKLSYSKRVQRSTNNELNPYPEREHSETMEQGDPNIRPEFIDVVEVGFTKDLKKVSLYGNVYGQFINDIVNRVNSVYNDTILNRIYTNAGKAQLLGSEIGITYLPVKKVKVFLGGNTYFLKMNGTLFNNSVQVDNNGWVYSINTNVSYQISPSFSTQFNMTYLSARNTAQGRDSRFYQPNISLKKTLMNNKMSIGVQWQNLAFGQMKVNEQRITTWGKGFYTTTNYIQETNIFMINISYLFNKIDKKAKLPASEFGEKEF